MRRLPLFVLGLALLAAGARAATPAETLEAARAAYDRGEYAAAAGAYATLREQGYAGAELDYNLGNAEFKAGHLGRAIAAYRRALRVAPRDEDVLYNLAYARSFVNHPAERAGFLTRLAGRALVAFSAQALALSALAAFWLLSALAAGLILAGGRSRGLRWVVAGAGLLFVVLAGWASARILSDRSQRWGVVVVAQAEARNGPAETYQVGFMVPEGREVRVLGRERDWVAIGLPSEGYKGWVRRTDLLEDE